MNPDEKPNMLKMIGVTLLYAYFIAFILQFNVIHQMGVYSATEGIQNVDPSVLDNFMKAYAETFRSFKHGALHGTMVGLFLCLPTIGTGAIYEKKSFKYVMIAGGYWVVTCALMGGIICGWN